MNQQDEGVARPNARQSPQDDAESMQGGGSLIESVASILDELASTDDGTAVRAADGQSICPGSECPSTFGPVRALALVSVVLLLVFVIRAARRSNAGSARQIR
jgi:hypothetical protein